MNCAHAYVCNTHVYGGWIKIKGESLASPGKDDCYQALRVVYEVKYSFVSELREKSREMAEVAGRCTVGKSVPLFLVVNAFSQARANSRLPYVSFPFVKLAVTAEPTASVALTARETAALASARDATERTAAAGPNSASAPRRPSVAAPSVAVSRSVFVYERVNESRMWCTGERAR